tara:strand:+ start:254 stop:1906 length:1653 start_codon:yes stop_codon:yes gene_type:complete
MEITNSGLYQLFSKEDKSTWATVLAAAVLAGLFQGLIVLLINQIAANLNTGGLHIRYLLLVALALLAFALLSYYSTTKTVALAEQAMFNKYLSIADSIRRASTIGFEDIGKGHIYSTLQTNVHIIVETSKTLSSIGAAIVMIIFCGVYIAYISKAAIVIVLSFYLFGIFVYATNHKNIGEIMRKGAALETDFIRLFRHFIEGFKELKVDTAKGDDLYDNHMVVGAEAATTARVETENRLATNSVFVQSFYYAMIAATLVLLPQLGSIPTQDIIKIAAVVLFSYGSMTRIVMSIPLILKAETAINRLSDLEKRLLGIKERDTPCKENTLVLDQEMSIELRNAHFSYPSDKANEHFVLGPVDLSFKAGEIVFLVGGNGSGKTTLLKTLCGLYRPHSGELLVNGMPLQDSCYQDYRNAFSVIFPDYCIFDKFYGQDVDQELVSDLLEKMGLEKVTSLKDGGFTNLKLSAGQRKRLAILCAHVESGQWLVMDEVAADLDPEFKKFFYEAYLDELRKAGKTIIAVSHDEKYFHLADRVIKCEEGRIVAGITYKQI